METVMFCFGEVTELGNWLTQKTGLSLLYQKIARQALEVVFGLASVNGCLKGLSFRKETHDALQSGLIPEMGVTCLEECIGPVVWVKTSELLLGVLTR